MVVVFLLIAIMSIGTYYGVLLCKSILFPDSYSEYIEKYASENGLDKYLVMAVIKTESDFIPDAHSGKATGLMQLTDDTGNWVAERMNIKKINLKDPELNVKLGCYYLKYLIMHYDSIDTALAAYNGGMGNVDKWLKNKKYSSDGVNLKSIPFKETSDYVKKVKKNYEKYKEMYGKE